MKKFKLVSIGLLCVINILAQEPDSSYISKLNTLEKDFEYALDISKAPGFGIAIVQGDEIIYAKGFGYADIEKKTSVNNNTVFAIGSSTKAFTASLIGILQDQGKVDFKAQPRKYIPELEFFNAEMNTHITVKDLMTHSTGLPRHDEAWKSFPTNSQNELLLRLAYQKPISPVKSIWYYNNFMYFVQGVISERLTDKSWGANIERSLFDPLEMTSSTTNIKGLENNDQAATGYYFNNGSTTEIDYDDIGAMAAAGGINSSPNDMAKWIIAWLNNGQYKGKQALPAKYVNQAISSQVVIAGKLPKETDPHTFMMNYGYGWFISSYKSHYRADHGGNIAGFTANIALYPADDLGIVVLTNQNRSALPQIITNIVADKLFDASESNWIEKLEQIVQQQTKFKEAETIVTTEPIRSLKDYTGSYEHKGYGAIEITIENDSLHAKFPAYDQWLNPVLPNVFETYYVLDNQIDIQSQGRSIKFNTDIDDKVVGLEISLERTLDPIFFSRTK